VRLKAQVELALRGLPWLLGLADREQEAGVVLQEDLR
jgi:hypothetical protein